MNAVDVAEQLMAVGRQWQAMERKLRQPVVALESFVTLSALLVDPVAQLSDLLVPHINPQPAPRSLAALKPAAPYQWQIQSGAPLDAPVKATVAPNEATSVAQRDQARFSEERAYNADGGSPRDASATTRAQPTPAPLKTEGVRLMRDRSSLLSILQSNLHSNTPTKVAQPSPAIQPEAVIPADNRGALSGELPVNRTKPWTTDNSSRSHASIAAWNNSRAPENNRETANQALSEAPALTQRDNTSPLTRIARSNRELPGVDGVPITNNSQFQPLSDETVFNDMQSSPSAPVDSEIDIHWFTSPPASQEVTIWPEPTNTTMALSAAQIDQILDALDDRLELMLLRMYGTVGN